jgi:hypothetical protein
MSARGDAVVWGTVLQAGRSRVRFRPHYFPGIDSVCKKMNIRKSFGDKGGRCVGLTTLHLHVPTVRMGLSRSVQGSCTFILLMFVANNGHVQWTPVGSESVSKPPFPVTELRRIVDVQVTGRDREQEARNVILTFLPREINTNPVV